MDNPLGYKLYLKRNRMTVVRYMLTLAICIFIAGGARIVVNNPRDELMLYTDKYKAYTIIASNNGCNIDAQYVETIKKMQEVQEVYAVEIEKYSMNAFLCDEVMTVYKVHPHAIKRLIKIIDPSKQAINVPCDKQRVIASSRTLNYLKIKCGDRFPYHQEYICENMITTDLPLVFYPSMKVNNQKEYIIFSKAGMRAKLNQKLRQTAPTTIDIEDYETMKEEDRETEKQLTGALNLAIILITIASCIIVGMMTYAHYYNRRYEIGILRAIGYSEKLLIRRITKEIIITTIITGILASLFLVVFTVGMNLFIAIPQGSLKFKLSKEIINIVLIIPVFMLFFSVTSTWIAFKSKDNITLIQKES